MKDIYRDLRNGKRTITTQNGAYSLEDYLSGKAFNLSILYSPEKYAYIDLDKDAVYDIDTGRYTIHLQVQNGGIRFIDSPCPDHLCENFGTLHEVGDWAACMPAKASVTVVENKS